LLANFKAILEPIAAGVPICTNACVILPAALAFAVSSKMFIVSKKDLIELEARLNPKTKKKFRENEPVVRRSDYAKSLEENEFDFIANNSMQIADDIVNFEMYVDNKPESEIAGKKFRGILPYAYDNKGKPVPNYESIQVDQVFYNPEDGLFYERVAEEGIIGTDFRALDPFTYD